MEYLNIHSAHLFLILIGFILGLIIWFFDKKFRSLVVLTLLIFTVFHLSPAGLVLEHVHQSQDQASQHPCCAPQAITTASEVAIPIFDEIPEPFFDSPKIQSPFLVSYRINNKSPPNS